MKIGITERGDAGLDYNWVRYVESNFVDGAILITKNINPRFVKEVIRLHTLGKKLIVHCTCTGWGNTVMEPNVPDINTQLCGLQQLIKNGFPKENCVLRIDPIFPTDNGLYAVTNVIDRAHNLGLLPDMRIRISIYDEYNHVKERIKACGLTPMYGSQFYAPTFMVQNTKAYLRTLKQQYNLNKFETCAEKNLNDTTLFLQTGCVSGKDLLAMGFSSFDINVLTTNPQNRTGCKCLSCKTELLTNRHRCPHQCMYCYWKD
jgi:hypothetical protein